MFREERCDLCGECLVRCPELGLARAEAVTEMERLVRGEASRVLTSCSSCFSCNTYCPTGANPYDLVLSRRNDRYHRLGSPPAWRFIFPTEKSHLWSAIHVLFPERARRTVETWMGARPSERVFLPGSFYHLVPEVLAATKLLDDVTILGLPGHWEGGAYLYQGGYLDVVRRIGKMVREDLDRWGVREVIVGLDSVHTLFTRIHPRENGIRFRQTFVNFHDWLLERIDTGELRITRPLGRTVTLHDNCYAKAEGNRAFDRARRLLDLAGVRVEEMKHHREDALCCGFGRGAGWEKNLRIPFDILRATVRRIREAEQTGADTLVTYCAGCFWLLLAGRELMRSPVRVVHLVELLREATEETVEFPREDRAWDILAVMTVQLLRTAPEQFGPIQEIRAHLDPAEWRARPQRLIRAFRRSLDHPMGRDAFRAAFFGLEPRF